MILVSVDGFFQFLPKLKEEKVSSRMEKNGKNHGKNHPMEETANPDFVNPLCDIKHFKGYFGRLQQNIIQLHHHLTYQ